MEHGTPLILWIDLDLKVNLQNQPERNYLFFKTEEILLKASWDG
jgi:hypothetical protein